MGATLGGMAGVFLKAATVLTEKTVETIKLTKYQIAATVSLHQGLQKNLREESP